MSDDAETPEEALPDDGNIVQVHLDDGSDGVEEIIGIRAEMSQENQTTDGARYLYLTRGGDIEKQEDGEYEIYSEERMQQVIWSEPAGWMGYYLYGLESAGVEEEVQRHEGLLPHMDPYIERQETFTTRQRRHHCLDMLEWRVENGDWVAERYLSEGATWRETGLTESAQTLAVDIQQQITCYPDLCYKTAQMATKLHAKNHRVQYCEGVALPQQASHAVRHAWIEIDGAVVELTWPWHPIDGGDAVYFGITFDSDEVVEARENRQMGGALIADEEEVQEVTAAMRGEEIPDQ